MKNYNIENKIDFYKELYSSLNDDKEVQLSNDLCLITNLPLKEKFVELTCGHKFNYDPLYKDIFNHKKKYNTMEQNKNKLRLNQIRCPYCRNIQNELLPYYEELGYPKENGINFFDLNNNHNCSTYVKSDIQCQYQIITNDISGNSHSYQCNHFGYVHYSLKKNYNIENKYCYTHKLAVTKSIKEELKEKAKAKKLEEQNKKKQEKLKLKLEIAQKKLADKKLLDQNKKIEVCKAILKTGKYKGTNCKNSVYNDCLCKRHYNYTNKDNNVENKDIEII
jgi:hypothetical protein